MSQTRDVLILDMSFYDLARMTRIGTEDEITRLTMQQERGLAKDPLVLSYFYLLLIGRTPAKIAKEFGLDDQQQATRENRGQGK